MSDVFRQMERMGAERMEQLDGVNEQLNKFEDFLKLYPDVEFKGEGFVIKNCRLPKRYRLSRVDYNTGKETPIRELAIKERIECFDVLMHGVAEWINTKK